MTSANSIPTDPFYPATVDIGLLGMIPDRRSIATRLQYVK